MGLSIEKQIETKMITLVGNSAKRWSTVSGNMGANDIYIKCNPPEELAYGEAGEVLAVKCKVDVAVAGYAPDDTTQTSLDSLYESVVQTLMGVRKSSFSGLTGITVQTVSLAGGDSTMDDTQRVRLLSLDLGIELT